MALAAPAGTVFSGSMEGTASVGTFDPYYGRGWRVSSLGPGQRATLTVNLFLLAPAAPATYAEVSASAKPEPDSAPGNGRGRVTEDDEASHRAGARPLHGRPRAPRKGVLRTRRLSLPRRVGSAGRAAVPPSPRWGRPRCAAHGLVVATALGRLCRRLCRPRAAGAGHWIISRGS